MRYIGLLLFVLVLQSSLIFAQTPDQFKYQAVLRNTDGTIMTEESVTVVISILRSDLTTSVFEETHNITTSSYGLINLNIGSEEDLSVINWDLDEYFIEISVNGITIGTTQLLSVPYALHAKTAENITESDPVYLASEATNITSNDITNLSNLSGINTGDQDLSGLAIQAALEDTALAIKAGIPDVSGFLTSETDPVYLASEATNITSNDITNLSNLSGINTGDQDLSTLATQTALEDTASGIRNNIPDVSGFISNETDPTFTSWNKSYTDLINTPNVIDSVNAVIDTSSQFIRTEVDGDVTNEIQNLSEVLTQDNSANSQIKNLTNPTEAQDAATKAYVDSLGQIIKELETLVIGPNTLTDYDGNTYQVIRIGSQVWMAENLRTSKYNDGADIPLVQDLSSWTNLNSAGYCWYENDPGYKNPYGALYNWYAVISNKLCPENWHVPTDYEWTVLIDYLGGVDVAGGKMKEIGTTHWNSPNSEATNQSEFTGLPGGQRSHLELGNNGFDLINTYGIYWTSTVSTNIDESYCWHMYYNDGKVHRMQFRKRTGNSVRCIKD